MTTTRMQQHHEVVLAYLCDHVHCGDTFSWTDLDRHSIAVGNGPLYSPVEILRALRKAHLVATRVTDRNKGIYQLQWARRPGKEAHGEEANASN